MEAEAEADGVAVQGRKLDGSDAASFLDLQVR